MHISEYTKYTFSGHNSFQCRLLWLKKGYDFLINDNSFNNADAPVILGVGSNMVRSIRYWLRAFGLIDEDDQLSDLAHLIFAENNGQDPFLEDQGTLWLLHYQLIKTRFASSYWIIFNELRRRRPEFSKEDYIHFITKIKAEQENFQANPNTVSDDFGVFTKLYIRGNRHSNDREEGFAGILTELNLIKQVERKSDDGKSISVLYSIPYTERESLPSELILYALLDDTSLGLSVSLETIETAPGMPCLAFAMNRSELIKKIEQLISRYPEFLTYSDQAGVRELQFKQKSTDKYKILRDYYASNHV